MLEGVLEAGGTAAAVRSPATRSPARPGPPQKVVDGVYSDTEFVASFVGFAPAEDPELLVAVVVDNPKGDYYGGTVAAPAFGEIARFALPYLGIPRGECRGVRSRTRPRIAAMELRELLAGADVIEIHGDAADRDHLASPTTAGAASPGTLFFAYPGTRPTATTSLRSPSRRARARWSPSAGSSSSRSVVQAQVADGRAAMAHAAVRFYDDPTAELRVVGITGTNGKTTTAFLVRHILEHAGIQTGLLGTVKRVVGGVEEEVERTTPEAIDLQATFRRMVDAGDRACAMEVSSHALACGAPTGSGSPSPRSPTSPRTTSTSTPTWRTTSSPSGGCSRAGAPSARWSTSTIPTATSSPPSSRRRTFSASGAERADLRALDLDFDAAGARFRLRRARRRGRGRRCRCPGRFNVENALCAIAVVAALGVGLEEAVAALADAARVPGRFEPVDEGQPLRRPGRLRAHPRLARERARLPRARSPRPGRLICVFGCGGDRDREKRPLMGEIAARLADLAVVTSDNPRSEEPAAIVAEIRAGMDAGGAEIEVEPDRRAAIALALGGRRRRRHGGDRRQGPRAGPGVRARAARSPSTIARSPARSCAGCAAGNRGDRARAGADRRPRPAPTIVREGGRRAAASGPRSTRARSRPATSSSACAASARTAASTRRRRSTPGPGASSSSRERRRPPRRRRRRAAAGSSPPPIRWPRCSASPAPGGASSAAAWSGSPARPARRRSRTSAARCSRFRAHASPENFNTEIGLPLAILAAPPETEVLVLEMAMRGRGQIAELCEIAEPDVAAITNVGPGPPRAARHDRGDRRGQGGDPRRARPSGGRAVVPADAEALAPHLRDELDDDHLRPGRRRLRARARASPARAFEPRSATPAARRASSCRSPRPTTSPTRSARWRSGSRSTPRSRRWRVGRRAYPSRGCGAS